MTDGDSEKADAEQEFLPRKLMEAGERLLSALKLEHDLLRRNNEDKTSETLSQMRECRRLVEKYSEDYALATAQWRRFASRPLVPGSPCASSILVGTPGHQFCETKRRWIRLGSLGTLRLTLSSLHLMAALASYDCISLAERKAFTTD